MNRRRRSKKDLGIPEGLAPELREQLAKELELMGATYTELVQAAEVPISPEQLLELVKRWNRLSPTQKATWDQAATQQNLSGADPASRN
jgi:hypothetical protein